ncbi:MAG TPA: TetR/AcrR family transcriptional regulator, partial [Solirubrobacteraceae bacterium]|nr:TetR/AcrR family transcriptional regulator [Solirubrobacteraceae bacterium]
MSATASPRREELLERAYRYALEHGVADISLRPLAAAVGSSPRVLLFLFGSKAGLVQALLARARRDELALLDRARAAGTDRARAAGTDERDPAEVAAELWEWLAAEEHRGLLKLWVEGYARSLIDAGDGPWAGFARATVADWLKVLGELTEDVAECTLILAVLRGALLDLLATGEAERVGAAVARQLELLR